MNTVKDKVILVTGANRGIGEAYVRCFRQHGAKKIYATGRNVSMIREKFVVGSSDDASATTNSECEIVPLFLDLADRNSIVEASRNGAAPPVWVTVVTRRSARSATS